MSRVSGRGREVSELLGFSHLEFGAWLFASIFQLSIYPVECSAFWDLCRGSSSLIRVCLLDGFRLFGMLAARACWSWECMHLQVWDRVSGSERLEIAASGQAGQLRHKQQYKRLRAKLFISD